MKILFSLLAIACVSKDSRNDLRKVASNSDPQILLLTNDPSYKSTVPNFIKLLHSRMYAAKPYYQYFKKDQSTAKPIGLELFQNSPVYNSNELIVLFLTAEGQEIDSGNVSNSKFVCVLIGPLAIRSYGETVCSGKQNILIKDINDATETTNASMKLNALFNSKWFEN